MEGYWYWIELTGFDRTAEDYGVGDFMSRTSGKAEGVSFLFADLDFVNLHDGITGKTLSPSVCSYGGLPYGEERPRQPWKDTELKGLTEELKRHGVKVLFSFFNTFTYQSDDGKFMIGEFCNNHHEIWDRYRNGEEVYGVNVLKNLSDGTPYSEYLFAKINEVIKDYGFDGVHLADGISTARLSVMNGDFSDDLAGRFVTEKGIKELKAVTHGKRDYAARRKIIIEKYYAEYLDYLTGRWAEYYRRAFEVINGIIIFNNAWTCDPFESYYRYGFDYNAVKSEKAYAMMVEEVSPTRPILSKEDNAGYDSTEKDCAMYHYKHYLMQLSNKINSPDTKLVALTPVRDTAEQWDIIRHSPMELQRALVRRNHAFIYRNGLKKCISAPFFCLSSAVPKNDWDWLNSNVDGTDTGDVEKALGYTVLYSRSSLKEEIKNYVLTKDYSSSELNLRLLMGGLDIGSMTDFENVLNISTPVLVTDYDFLSEQEKNIVKKIKAPLVVVGKKTQDVDGYRISAVYDFVLVNVKPYEGIEEDAEKLLSFAKVKMAKGVEDDMGGIWTCPLKYNTLPEEYFRCAAKIISKAANLAECSDNAHLSAFRLSNGKYRYIISNDAYKYNLVTVTHNKKIKNTVSKLKYHGYKVPVNDEKFTDRVPPRGVCVDEVEEVCNNAVE